MVKATITIELEYPNDAPMSILENLTEELVQQVNDEIDVEASGNTCFN